MVTVNYSRLRANLKDYCDQVAQKGEVVVVSRRSGGDVVMISTDRYNELTGSGRTKDEDQMELMLAYMKRITGLLEGKKEAEDRAD